MAEALSTAVRLGDRYRDEIRPALQEQLGLANVMQVPELVKIVVNMGVGLAAQQAKRLDGALADLEIITGQKPKITRAKKSISNFKLREGQAIGAMVTLRGVRMYEFLDRLVSVAIPRVRDFRGLRTRSFDGRGNFTMGVREQIIFPEIDFDKVGEIHGMDITVVTSTDKDDVALALLRAMGFPFRGEIPIIIEHTAN
ncbi:MAG TPA: 50S ribosomal protein L5 [Gemmatimonadetes bacterium]|nr:50S ribosomal protein L5 [Gemmatimonadota bacterium]